MLKILIVYFSRTGNTEDMAKAVEQGALAEGAVVERKRVEDVSVDRLTDFDGVIIGSPTYFGTMAADIKRFVDESIKHFRKLDGKVGGAFSSCGGTGGGGETTILDILKALLIHGMVVQGTSEGGHYGPMSIGKPKAATRAECEALGQRVARLAKRMSP